MDCKFNTELGLVTVSDEVLVRVAGYAALDCYGIVGMASKRSTDGIVQLMGRENLGRGVKIRTSGDKVDIDLFIIVEYGISISAVAAAIIETVKYKVEHLTGIPSAASMSAWRISASERGEIAEPSRAAGNLPCAPRWIPLFQGVRFTGAEGRKRIPRMNSALAGILGGRVEW